jgi:TetR/AcrR family transcriptional regulator, tetracycline repressor protein
MRLERATVVRAALALLNEVGLDALTVRQLAERLGVTNPALYWHFKNKQELLNYMAEVMVADAFFGLRPPMDNEAWAEWLAEVAGRFRHALLSHRNGARVVATADLTRSEMFKVLDLALRVLTEAGFDLRMALGGTVTILDYTLGATFEEQAEPLHTLTDRIDRTGASGDALDLERLPMLAAALNNAADAAGGDRAGGFDVGVQLILGGMRAAKLSPN